MPRGIVRREVRRTLLFLQGYTGSAWRDVRALERWERAHGVSEHLRSECKRLGYQGARIVARVERRLEGQ